ncbi:MAG TPA: cupin domain-containing protein [Woeseiaceae bacterium]|nr:cupin domain-containing protein [Woeseiaceae bacterium]
MSNKAKPGETWTSERCYISELLNHDGSPEVSIARARVEPGVTTQLHALAVAEWYVIESGLGLMTVGDAAPREVRAGDTVSIPRGVAQRIHNYGDCDLIFLCVCVPRFLLRHYTSLE